MSEFEDNNRSKIYEVLQSMYYVSGGVAMGAAISYGFVAISPAYVCILSIVVMLLTGIISLRYAPSDGKGGDSQ